MDQGETRRRKVLHLGIPFLLLILYLVWVPSPSVNKIYIQSDLGYVAEGYEFKILMLTPQGQIAPLSSMNLAYTVKDLTITPRFAYVITSDGIVHVIDISDPFNLKIFAEFSTPGTPQSLAIYNDLALIADETGGVRIVNIHDFSRPTQVGFIEHLGVVFDTDVVGNLLYAARGEQGLDIYDLSNLGEPALRGHYDAGRSIGQVKVQNIIGDDGKEAIRATLIIGERALQVVDFTNIQQPLLLNSFDFGRVEIEQALLNGRRLFIAQGRSGLLISRIKDDGQLETLANINTPRNTFGFALMGDTVFLATGFEGLQAFDITKFDSVHPIGIGYSKFWNHKIWIAILSFAFLLLWLAFFAQFVLPVRTFRQRQKIFDRLIRFLLGRHGQAIFVENGHKVERMGEGEKKRPGVVWLDTASAAVIRTATKFKEAIGPGVHFTEKDEYLAGPLDLHTQVDSLGPFESDKPFENQTDDQSDEAFRQIQYRRKLTSALTRDGIEVVPTIAVDFRVDTQPADDDQLGSRFGYRTATHEKDKDNEERDKEAIYRAIAGEGIDPTAPEDRPRHRVAWNQLPGRLAVDLWREYVAKFTLDELFIPTQVVPPIPPPLPQPKPEEIEAIKHPIRVGASRETSREAITNMLGVLNRFIAGFADWIEGKEETKAKTPRVDMARNKIPAITNSDDVPRQTALQVINEMVKKRLTQAEVELLGDTGIPGKRTIHSNEYDLLCKRGLKVSDVSINDLRLKESVEKYIIAQWTANWYNNAKSERERIERRRGYVEIRGEEDGESEYVHALARHIMMQKPETVAETLRALLMRTRLTIVRNDQLQRRLSAERQDIEDLLQWVEDSP